MTHDDDNEIRLDLPEGVEVEDLPAGWRFGRHWSDHSRGVSGYYLLCEDGRTARARLRPDLVMGDDEDDNFVVSREEIAEALK